jgi:hypothetical protein
MRLTSLAYRDACVADIDLTLSDNTKVSEELNASSALKMKAVCFSETLTKHLHGYTATHWLGKAFNICLYFFSEEATLSSKAFVITYQATWRHSCEYHNPRRRRNLHLVLNS